MALWRGPVGDPHPAMRLDPWQAAERIMECWDRARLASMAQWARLAILRLAVHPYQKPEQCERVVAWACQEAPYWWSAFDGKPAEKHHLVSLLKQFDETGRV